MTIKSTAKRVLSIAAIIIALLALLAAIEFLGGQPMGLFSGSRPEGLGFTGGKFKPPSWKPNTVSSTVEKSDKHYIEPIAFAGSPDAAWNKLIGIVKSEARATVIEQKTGYLYAEFKSAGMGFVDDTEFALDAQAGVIHARSGARLGIRDFNVNRNRIESIRAKMGAN